MKRACARSRSFSGDPDWCHICGLDITVEIVSESHPAYPTIDHLIPLSRGGVNSFDNRRIAHRWCNLRKAARFMQEIKPHEIEEWRKFIAFSLNRSMIVCGPAHIHKAKKRVIGNVYPLPVQKIKQKWFDAYRWEDDGGAVLPLVDFKPIEPKMKDL